MAKHSQELSDVIGLWLQAAQGNAPMMCPNELQEYMNGLRLAVQTFARISFVYTSPPF